MKKLLLVVLLVCFCSGGARAALQAEELVLIVNKNVPASAEVANFYARARNVPESRIITLDLPSGEEMTFDQYERDIVPLLRQRLTQMQNVRCLVTTLGVPLRVAGRKATLPEGDEARGIQKTLAIVKSQLVELTQTLESLAAEQDPAFAPTNTREDAEALSSRVDKAIRDAATAVGKSNDRVKIQVVFGRLKEYLAKARGKAATLETSRGPVTMQQLENRRTLQNLQEQMQELQAKRFDPDARKQLREVMEEWHGLIGQMRTLSGQYEYLTASDTTAAFDSELSMVMWPQYPRGRDVPNLLHWRVTQPQASVPVLMVSRLDAPTDAIVRKLIEDGIEAEKEGLNGCIVIDAGGAKKLNPQRTNAGYWEFEKSLNALYALVKDKTKLHCIYDDRPELLAPGAASDVAMYCGWYQLRTYQASCKLNPGAVGYHTASFELVSLHTPGEKGWVAGLLKDGIAATLGPVAEPYLHTFPPPDEFFPLLMTGKLTLAEVYWKTTPVTSWMLTLIGDPLYTPYRNDPPLKVEDLPDKLRSLRAQLGSSGAPATRPATAP